VWCYQGAYAPRSPLLSSPLPRSLPMPTDPHPPRRYQRSSDDTRRELDGVFMVMHIDPPKLEATLDSPDLSSLNCSTIRPLRWLWQDKIPLGKLTIIEGPPGIGKLYAALDIAARISTGELCVEDSWNLPEAVAQRERDRERQEKRDKARREKADKERGRQGDKENKTGVGDAPS